MIAPGSLNKVIINIVHTFTGIFIFIKDPSKFIAKININASNKDLKSHFKNFFIYITHIIIWDKTICYAYFLCFLKHHNLFDHNLAV